MAFEIVVVGTSRGGLKAVEVLLSGLAEDFPAAVILVMHRSKEQVTGLVQTLSAQSRLPVTEPEDKEPIISGRVYLAPPDYHLLIEDNEFALSIDSPVRFARPSIDLLFESAARQYGERAIGIILTGQNQDGASGLAAMKVAGSLTIVQDPLTCESPAMPAAAIDAVRGHLVLPLEAIAEYLNEIVVGSALQYGR